MRLRSEMEDHGERLQYSVFLCDLSVAELAELESAVVTVMDVGQDSVVELDLGPVSAAVAVRCLGRPRRLPSGGGPLIV